MKRIQRPFIPWLLAVVTLVLTSCESSSPVAPAQPGTLIRVDSLDAYSVARSQAVIDSVLPLFVEYGTMPATAFQDDLTPPQQAVRLFKVTYASVIPEKNNAGVTAYGLIAIPENVQPGAPIISYQHGTIFDRSWTPSNPNGSMETQFMISQFAAQGYIVIAPDYFGTTQGSTVANSYFVAKSTAQSCLDMYKASKAVLEQRGITPGKLFVNGWSQGGYSTLLFLRALELEGIPVAGAATASGPADPLMFVSQSINNRSAFAAPFTVAALGNMMLSLDAYVGLQGYFEQSIKSDYLEKARALHRFEMPYEQFYVSVPSNIDSVCTPQFLEDSRSATKPFWKLLDDGAAYRWRMRTPLRAFYSKRDEAIPWQVARIAVDYQQTIGNTTAEAIDAGSEADHRSVYLFSLINIKPWFDSMR